MVEVFKRYAFISYNHCDVKIAKWLQQKLESYKLPAEIHNEFEDTRYLRPVFRDKTDLNTGILSDELKKNLKTSKYLIVICSPNSANSKWVSDEVQSFIDWGRLDYIIPFIVDGVPGSREQECFPLALRQLTQEHPEQELLGISISEVGREKALMRVVSRMLDVEFDVLWKRHLRDKKKRMIAISISFPVIVALLYYFSVPVSLSVQLYDDTHNLPMPDNAVLSIDGVEYQLNNLDTLIKIKSMPGYYKGRSLDIEFCSVYYDTIMKTVLLNKVDNVFQLNLYRDKTFSIYAGKVIGDDGDAIGNAHVKIESYETTTNESGYFRIEIPLNEQTEFKPIEIVKEGYLRIYREDESPYEELIYVLHNTRMAY